MTRDVVVVGSGAAGLTAALAAAQAGARVVLLEAARRWGGTTAVSGGLVFAPDNHHMAAHGEEDSRELARSYLRSTGYTRDEHLLDAFVDASPHAVRMIEDLTPITFHALDYPDTFAEAEGGFSGGRHLEADPIATGGLGPWRDLLWTRDEPVTTMTELLAVGMHRYGQPVDPAETERRRATGTVTGGAALVVGLLHGADRNGIDRRPGHRVTRIVVEDGAVTGVEAGTADGTVTLRADAVVLASGGFEWDERLNERLLHLPMTHPASPPSARGDSIRLAAGAGAQLSRTSESWSWPGYVVPGETWDGTEQDATPRFRLAFSEHYMPHAVWVNRRAERFVNEAAHNCALAFGEADVNAHAPRNLPAWVVVDAQFLARYPFAGVLPGEPLPDWIAQADTLEKLADVLGLDPDALTATVARFNDGARDGVDPDFRRGETAYERQLGDQSAPHPNLGTVEVGPFAALELLSGGVGSKGGARVTARAEVVDHADAPIPGLFAAGNAMGAVVGPGTFSGGMTVGNAVAWGYLAGRGAAGTPGVPA